MPNSPLAIFVQGCFRKVLPKELDARTGLLGCDKGILDLSMGELRIDRPDLLVRRMMHLDHRSDTCCPRFAQFFSEAQPDANEVQERSRSLPGYSRRR